MAGRTVGVGIFKVSTVFTVLRNPGSLVVGSVINNYYITSKVPIYYREWMKNAGIAVQVRTVVTIKLKQLTGYVGAAVV